MSTNDPNINNSFDVNSANNKNNDVIPLINIYFRANYIFIILTILTILLKKTDYIYWIFDIIKEYNSFAFIILLNIFAIYIILYKIKFIFTFSISYN